VDLNSANPVPPYADWSAAATNIQDAVDISSDGDLILVTNGIYRSGGRIVSRDGTSNRLAVTKAVIVQSINGPATTIIQGYQMPGTTNGPSAMRCVYLTNNAMLIGFTLTNGATISSAGTGGGARCQAVSAVISNCVVVGNAAVYGAGMAFGTAINCILSKNVAESEGGGGYAGNFNNCLFTGNFASSGGAAAAQLVSITTLNNCTVYGNSASLSGGGFASLGMTAPSYLFASNCIVLDNAAPTGANYIFGDATEIAMTYCCTTPLPSNGSGNFTNDPCFINPSTGNFHLQSLSPCINAGSSNAVGSTDLDGNPRLVGGFVDLGAYEYQLPAPVPMIPSIQATYTGVSTGIVVGFTGQIAGHATASRWDFGDGTVISNQLPNISHSWSTPGDYLAALWAYNDSYPNGLSATVIIHVLENPVHYVSQNNTNPVVPYLSWATAATNIQDAVDAAYILGTVIVSNGVYANGGKAVMSVYSGYMLTNRVAVMKQITVRSVNGPAMTTIQGYQVPSTINGSSAVRCVYLTNNTALIGFTLTEGATVIFPGSGMDYAKVQSGGGAFSESSSVLISNCVLVGNSAYIEGGGSYSGTLKMCLLIGNSVQAGEGGGSGGSTLDACILTGNSAAEAGGGACGGMLNNCILTGNMVVYDGGGACYSTLNNCTITGNSAAEAGGGAFGSTLNNCIAYYNTATDGANYLTDSFTGYGSYNSCCTTPLPVSGTGNFTNPPVFVNASGSNLRLQSNSPCINTGNNAYASGTTDLDGRPRIVGNTIDIGAYEFQPGISGLFIGWLAQFGLPTDGSADYTDPDGDGMNNWQEWRTGTNPNNASSVLRMLSPSNNLHGLNVTWQSVSGATYFLDRSSNLGSQLAFSTIQSNVAGQTGTTSYTDVTATNGGPYFYRVGVQ
jgi:hypothetical protein